MLHIIWSVMFTFDQYSAIVPNGSHLSCASIFFFEKKNGIWSSCFKPTIKGYALIQFLYTMMPWPVLFFCPCSCSYFFVLASDYLIILCYIYFVIYFSFWITFSISSTLFNMTLKSCYCGTANISCSCNMPHFQTMRLTSPLVTFNIKYLQLSCYLQLQLQAHLIGKHSEERHQLSANQL